MDVYTLANTHGVEVRVATYGGIIASLLAPDRDGRIADVVLGCDWVDGYVRGTPYFGAIVGRYANRIANARFTLDGATYQLAANNGPNHLHGGIVGFDKAIWRADPFGTADAVGVTLRHTSPDGDEGYPGTLNVRVTYTLTEQSELAVDYHATTDTATPINLTQHSYFNLAGAGSGDVLGHELQIAADAITPVDETLIPTGEIRPVLGGPFDFRTPRAIGAHIDDDEEQLRLGHGYDHNFVLRAGGGGGVLVHAARVVEPASGRTLDVHTTEPGMQLYTANFLDGVRGKEGMTYGRRGALCLETQHYPDSPNRPAFPSCIVRPGDEYRSRTVFTFGVAR